MAENYWTSRVVSGRNNGRTDAQPTTATDDGKGRHKVQTLDKLARVVATAYIKDLAEAKRHAQRESKGGRHSVIYETDETTPAHRYRNGVRLF